MIDSSIKNKTKTQPALAEEMLHDATTKLAAKGHPSTVYPPQFMPSSKYNDALLKIVVTVLLLTVMTTFAWFSSTSQDLPKPKSIVVLLTVLFPIIVTFTALWVCALYPLEYIEHLNFRSVQLINVGAIINLVIGHSHFVSFQSHQKDLGSFIGTTMLSFGTVMFSFCTMILGPWEFMAGSPLLTTGLLLRTCALYQKLLGINDEVNQKMNLIACPFLFLAIVFFFKKAYQLMRLPILCSDNFKFFGLILYASSIVANSVLSILQSKRDMSPMIYGFTVSVASVFAFFGTSIFLLDGSRMRHHCDAILEDRYPSTIYIVRDRLGFRFANCSSFIGICASFLSMIAHLYNDTVEAKSKHSSKNMTEFLASQVIVGAIITLCLFTLRPSLSYAVELNEINAKVLVRSLIAGFVLMAIGHESSGILSLVAYYDPDAIEKKTLIILDIIPCVGSCLLIWTTWPGREAVCKMNVTRPFLWDNIYHPSNYVLLASVSFLSGSLCKIATMHSLAWLFYSWAFFVLILHFHMAFYVYESMNLEVPDEEIENDFTTNKNFDKKSINESFDVIISGGGISGLFLACCLAKQDVSVALCERRKESITDARFAVLNSSSMEYMESIFDRDILAELESRALPPSTHYGSMLLNGLGHPKARVFSSANSPSRLKLMRNMDKIDNWTESRTLGSKYSSQLPIRIMQSHQEEILKMQLSRYSNVKCFEGWMVKDFHIDSESGVTAEIIQVNEDENGEKVSFEQKDEKMYIFGKYIVGCDGPKSLVASKLEIKFDGLLNLANTKSLLVHAPGLYKHVIHKLGNTHQYQVIRKKFGIAAIVAADPARDLWNFLFIFGKAKSASPEEICQQFLGTKNFEIKQYRGWYWNFFISREFRKAKRAFLVGDAAHSWPPFGALGGNTSYGDAMNLGWKLALACKGQASELLLDSYAIERRQHVLQTAMYVLRATPNPELMKILTSRLFYNPLYMPIIKAGWYHHNSGSHGTNHFSQSGIQLGIKQNFSPVITREEVLQPDDPSCEYAPVFRMGARLPFLPLIRKERGIFSFIDSASYSILVIKSDWVDTAKSLVSSIESRGFPVTMVVLPQIDPSSYNGNYLKIAHMLMSETLLVVRPDHIIAWRGREHPQQLDLLEEAASKITGLDTHQQCLKEEFDMSLDAETLKSYHFWLTREFRYSLRPYKFRFPKAIAVDNITKEAAIDLARAKKKQFSTTTKQGDEKIESRDNNKLVETVPVSGFEENVGPKMTPMYQLIKLASERKARGEPVYNFAVGNPRLEPPSSILQSMSDICKSTITGDRSGAFQYTHPAGLIELRKYLAKDISAWQNMPDLSHEDIICTPGAQSAIVNIFEALLQPEDQVLVQAPYYPPYSHVAKLWGAHTKEIAFKEQNFDICLEHLASLCEDAGNKLRIIALCSPSNPTGSVLPNETFLAIANLAKKHSQKYKRDVWIFMDHTYWRLTFKVDGVPATLPLYENTILVSSMSKDLSLAGERFGFIVVNPLAKYSKGLSNWLANNNDKLGNISPPSMIQHALLDVYKNCGALPNLKEIYEEKVSFMYEKISSSLGLNCKKPDGGFYLFPAIPNDISDTYFASKLSELGVLVIPGSCFGAPGHIRIAALPSQEEMVVACKLIGQVLEECKNHHTNTCWKMN